MRQLVIGTRHSQLATWQAEYVAARLRELHPDLDIRLEFITTQGDRIIDKPLPEIGGKGVFTEELEAALRAGQIDLAVHSLKDLPTELAADFVIGAVPERTAPYDALISRNKVDLRSLPMGATVGTSSLRRVAQLKAIRPDLNTESLRGNVPTRIDKVRKADSSYDAIILAVAGLDRLGKESEITEILAPEIMLPAPGQGALGIQCRADDESVRFILSDLDHAETHKAVDAERAFLNRLDSGCKLPVAALATINNGELHLTGRVCSLDGSQVITVQGDSSPDNGSALGRQLADQAIEQGAEALLNAIREEFEA